LAREHKQTRPTGPTWWLQIHRPDIEGASAVLSKLLDGKGTSLTQFEVSSRLFCPRIAHSEYLTPHPKRQPVNLTIEDDCLMQPSQFVIHKSLCHSTLPTLSY